MRILIVEDDEYLIDVLKENLAEQAYAVDTACTGEDGQDMAMCNPYDLIILDVKLPGKDGFEVCRTLRQGKISTPIILMTGNNIFVEDKVKGLDYGADDYIIKPFHMEELYARMRALLRRESRILPLTLKIGKVSLDPTNKQVTCNRKYIKLTVKEYAILEYLMRHAGTNISRVALEEHIWDATLDSSSNMIDVYIRRLRLKLGDQNNDLIQTVRGIGYRMNVLDKE